MRVQEISAAIVGAPPDAGCALALRYIAVSAVTETTPDKDILSLFPVTPLVSSCSCRYDRPADASVALAVVNEMTASK